MTLNAKWPAEREREREREREKERKKGEAGVTTAWLRVFRQSITVVVIFFSPEKGFHSCIIKSSERL